MNPEQIFEQIVILEDKLKDLQIQLWVVDEVFSFQFWFLIALLFLPWFIWWKFLDKKRFFEVLIFAFIVNTVVSIMDEIGCQMNFWDYRYDIEPFFPLLTPYNLTLFPAIYSLVYQYCKSWKSYILVNIALSAIFSFAIEPLFVLLNIYVLHSWKHIYSFPLYVLITVLFKALMIPIMKAHKKYNTSG